MGRSEPCSPHFIGLKLVWLKFLGGVLCLSEHAGRKLFVKDVYIKGPGFVTALVPGAKSLN